MEVWDIQDNEGVVLEVFVIDFVIMLRELWNLVFEESEERDVGFSEDGLELGNSELLVVRGYS